VTNETARETGEHSDRATTVEVSTALLFCLAIKTTKAATHTRGPFMPYDDREKPALAVVLNLLGWLAIFGAFGMVLIRSGYYTPPFSAPHVRLDRSHFDGIGRDLVLDLCLHHPRPAPDRASHSRDTRNPARWADYKGESCQQVIKE
jgi:hypothetical protein